MSNFGVVIGVMAYAIIIDHAPPAEDGSGDIAASGHTPTAHIRCHNIVRIDYNTMTGEVQWHGAIIGHAAMGEVRCDNTATVGHAQAGIDRIRDIGNIHMGMGVIRACGIGLKEG